MRKILSISIFLVVISVNLKAQDSTLTRDLESWLALGAQKKILDDKLTFGIQQQFRLDNNISRLYQYFTNLEADYKVYKKIKVGVGVRFIKSGNKKDSCLSEHRFNGDISYSHKIIDRLKIEERFRYQYRSNDQYPEYGTSKYRFRAKLNYNIKKWKFDPYLVSEIFYTKETIAFNYIDEVTETTTYSKFQKYRVQLGTTVKTGDVGRVKVFYMLEHQFKTYGTNYNIPINWHIIGINYTFNL